MGSGVSSWPWRNHGKAPVPTSGVSTAAAVQGDGQGGFLLSDHWWDHCLEALQRTEAAWRGLVGRDKAGQPRERKASLAWHRPGPVGPGCAPCLEPERFPDASGQCTLPRGSSAQHPTDRAAHQQHPWQHSREKGIPASIAQALPM